MSKKNANASREISCTPVSSPPPACTSIYVHQCGTEKCAKGHSFGPAIREHYLIHCVFSGKGKFFDGEHTYYLRKGQGFLIAPKIVTFYQADMEQPWEYGWVGFSGSDASHILRQCGIGRERPVFDFPKVKEVKSCIERIAVQHGTGGNSFETTSSMFLFFSLIQSNDSRKFSGLSTFDRAADYIHKNYSYPLTIPEVAGFAGVTRSQLFRIFKQTLGVSPQEYLIRIRLQNAVRLMRTTDLSVTEILYSCGFNDPSHFSRQFKLRYGVTPSEHLKTVRKSGLPAPISD